MLIVDFLPTQCNDENDVFLASPHLEGESERREGADEMSRMNGIQSIDRFVMTNQKISVLLFGSVLSCFLPNLRSRFDVPHYLSHLSSIHDPSTHTSWLVCNAFRFDMLP